jgi:hypothetical protein
MPARVLVAIGSAFPTSSPQSFIMAAVTEWFVLRFSASAERDPVPDLVLFTIGGFDRDTASHPEWTMLTPRRIFNYDNGLLEFGHHYLSALIVRDHQSTRWAVARFFDSNIPSFPVI